MHTTDAGATWSGTHVFRATGVHTPDSVAEVAEIVAAHRRIRVVGTRHSFNDIADSEVLLSLAGLAPDIRIDGAARTATVSGGTPYGVLAAELHAHGWALPNMGSLPHISVGGANATGTHGSGDRHGILATAVVGVELVTADGGIRHLDRSHPDFAGLFPSLGALGVMTSLTFAIEPTFDARQDVYRGMPWERALDDLDAVMAAGYSVSVSTIWDEPTVSRVVVKSRVDAGGDSAAPDDLLGAPRIPAGDPALAAYGANRTPMDGSIGPWMLRLPHFRLDAVPSAGDEIQSEYFVDRRHGAAALAAVRELGVRIAPHLIASEIRSVAADELWLSPAYRQASLAIHFTWRNHPEQVRALLPDIEAALAPFEPRPHWGKVFTLPAERITPRYPRLADFRGLRARMDPAGTFDNDYLRRVLGGSAR